MSTEGTGDPTQLAEGRGADDDEIDESDDAEDLDAGGERAPDTSMMPKDSGSMRDAGREAAAPRPDRDGGPSRDARPPDGPPDPAACALSGTYALRIDIDISWDGWALGGLLRVLSPGEGTMTMLALSSLDAQTREAVVKPCSASVPDFATDNVLASEVYGTYVPNEVWDRPSMPSWRTAWRSACNMPGCDFSTDAIPGVIGARVTTDPFRWPGPSDPRTGFEPLDHDDDGLPGITLIARGPDEISSDGRPYSYPPLVPTFFARTHEMMVALGMRGELHGELESCDAIAGSLALDGVYTRALGCVARVPETTEEFMCEPDHVRFLDENLPVWQVRGARFRSTRIQDSTCAAVRKALTTR